MLPVACDCAAMDLQPNDDRRSTRDDIIIANVECRSCANFTVARSLGRPELHIVQYFFAGTAFADISVTV